MSGEKTTTICITKKPRQFRSGVSIFARLVLGTADYQSSRTTTRVLIGNFIAARHSASRAGVFRSELADTCFTPAKVALSSRIAFA